MINYAVCIFLSAFLLFQIQPIISKTLLPWFGGTPAVWSSAMFFFENDRLILLAFEKQESNNQDNDDPKRDDTVSENDRI